VQALTHRDRHPEQEEGGHQANPWTAREHFVMQMPFQVAICAG
jgi:hypothetical protein